MKKVTFDIRIAEADTLSDAIVRLYKDASSSAESAVAKDANLSGVLSEVEALSAKLTTAIKSDKATSTLDEADIARDELIRNLADALSGYAAIPIKARKAAAKNLLAVFSKYGRQITSKNYAEESSLIESLLEDLGAENLTSDVASLEGIPELISELRSAQDAFNKASDAYTAAKTGKGESATSVKKTLLNILNIRLVPYLTAVEGLSDYKDFAAKVSSEIDKANSTVSARGK